MKLKIEVDFEQLEEAGRMAEGIWATLPDALYDAGLEAAQAGMLDGYVQYNGNRVGTWVVE